MAERWIQDLLLPEKVYKSLEKSRMRGPLAFTTIDATPFYDDRVIIDEMKIKLGNPPNLKFSIPDYPTTPLDLVQPHHAFFGILQSADSTKRGIESVAELKIENNDINVMVDSPIKSLAWILFLKATKQMTADETNININFTKVIIGRLGKIASQNDVLRTEVLHVVRIIDPKFYRGEQFKHFSKKDMMLMKSRVKIFNGCLKTATKIFATETKEEIVYTK